MARKRLNKNLVAFLTVMGILLSVVVVFLATSRGARKDPEFWAVRARSEAAREDYELAIRLFEKAYDVSRGPGGVTNVSYLVEAARAAYQYGAIGDALRYLRRAHFEQPANVEALVGYLEHIWELWEPAESYQVLPREDRDTILEFAQTLQELAPQHVLGPVSEAVVRWAMTDEDPQAPAQADAALQRAMAINENDSRVVRARIAAEQRRMVGRLDEARATGAASAELEAIAREFTDSVVAIFKAGVEANPADMRLVGTYVDYLRSQGQTEEGRAILERAWAERPSDPELQLAMAKFLWGQLLQTRPQLTPEAYAERLSQVTRYARRAVELELAMYDAYAILAQAELEQDFSLARASGPPTGETPVPPRQRYEAALQIYERAIGDTVGVHSLQATLGEHRNQRRLLFARAFNTGFDYCLAPGTPEEKEQRLARLRDPFLKSAEDRYPDEPFTYYLQGRYAIAARQPHRAIQAFQQAEAGGQADRTRRYPWIWFQAFAGVLPVQHLALLYRERGEPGESLRYTEQAIDQYTRLNVPLPLGMALHRAELLNLLDRPQEAYDYAFSP